MRVGYFSNDRGQTLFSRKWIPNDYRGIIVFLHGYGEHSGKYIEMGEKFNRDGFGFCIFDYVGHGLSSGHIAYIDDYQNFIEDAKMYVETLKKEYGGKYFLMGHSLGGNLAIQLSYQYPIFEAVYISAPMLKIKGLNQISEIIISLVSKCIPNWKIPYSTMGGQLLTRNSQIQQAYVDDPLIYKDSLKVGMCHQFIKACSAAQKLADKWTTPFCLAIGTKDYVCDIQTMKDFYQKVPSKIKIIQTYNDFYHELLFEPNNDQCLSDCQYFFNQFISSSNSKL